MGDLFVNAFKVVEPEKCKTHSRRVATSRVLVEQDSHGSEHIYMCSECAEKRRKASVAGNEGNCDWCSCYSTELKSMRDFEEGSAGRVYDVCSACATKQQEEVARELALLESDDD